MKHVLQLGHKLGLYHLRESLMLSPCQMPRDRVTNGSIDFHSKPLKTQQLLNASLHRQPKCQIIGTGWISLDISCLESTGLTRSDLSL